MHRALLLYIFLIVISSCNEIGYSSKIEERLKNYDVDSLISKELKIFKTPAIAIGLFDADTILVYAQGVKGINDSASIEIGDRYNIGSCTKAITSLLAAILSKKELISLSTTIKEIYRDDTSTIHPYYLNKTLGDLLSHRAGIHPFVDKYEFDNIPSYLKDPDKAGTRQLYSKWVLSLPPVTDVTKKFIYSNAGYTVAASMLEIVSHKSWEELIQEEIYSPLNIEGQFGWPQLYSDKETKGHLNLHDFYAGNKDELIQFQYSPEYNVSFIEPAGNITLSIGEHAIILQEILRGLNGKGNLLNTNEYKNLLISDYGYINGWYQLFADGNYYLGHEGSNGPYYARAIICKDKNYGFVILSNSGDKRTIEGIQYITDELDKQLSK